MHNALVLPNKHKLIVGIIRTYLTEHQQNINILVWCGMSEICLKKILAQIDSIVFFTSLGVKQARNIGDKFFPPLNLVL